MANARQFMAARTGAWAKAGGFDLCDYIMTDGNAYIDTGFVPFTRIGFELEYAVSSFVRHVVFSGMIANGEPEFEGMSCYFGSLHSDRRSCYHVGAGTNAFWNSSANGTNKYFDGNFHIVNIPYDSSVANSIGVYENILIDNSSINTVSDIAKGKNILPTNPITVFAAALNTVDKIHQVPASINLKLRKISFYNSSNVLVADFRAAKKNGEYGLGNIVTNSFHGGIGGTILGHDNA